MKWTRRLLSKKNQRGIAIPMAMFCLLLMVYIAEEISHESIVEYGVHAKSIQRLKAYYAARSGLELSLLRIKIYKKIQTQFGKQLGSNAGMLNLIWSFPLNWPPILPDAASGVDKELIKDKVKAAKMDSTFVATIFDEGSKIDINDLDSPSKVLREVTKKQLLKIFESKKENDQDWGRAHSDFKPEVLINHIADWVDADKTSLNGGDESQFYPKPPPEVSIWPPNRSFRSLEEVRLVATMTDEIFQILSSRITIYGSKAINPNSASRDVLQSLDTSMSDEVVTEVLKRRDNPTAGGFFSSKDDFWNFVNAKGGRVAANVMSDTPLIFDAVTNFRIQSIGEYKGEIREINAIVYDIPTAAKVVSEKMKKEAAESQTGAQQNQAAAGARPAVGTGAANPAAQNQTPSKGPPRIVYWHEK